MKLGLVLEGGAMRGVYTAGVLDVFLGHNIHFDLIVGASAGALFGVNYLSGQQGRVIRYNKRYNRDKNYMGVLPLLREGNIISTKYAYEDVPLRLDPFDDETFKKSDTHFYAVLTDVSSGEPEYIRIESVISQMDALRASGSMPFVSKPVTLGGKAYLDGGVSDSIPYGFALSRGCDRIVVILTRDAEYRKKPMSKPLTRLWYKNTPLSQTLLKRHEQYNRALSELKDLESTGRAAVLRPSAPIKIHRLERDPDKLQSTYDLGVKDGQAFLRAEKNSNRRILWEG